MVKPISREELAARIEQGDIVVVEALGDMYYEDAHLPGALNLPPNQVDELAPSLLPDKDAAVAVYCSNTPCQNSIAVAKHLVELGYTDVYDYVEGKQDWIEAGLPVERSAARVG